MKKIYILALSILLYGTAGYCATTAFDSMDKAVEVKLNPSVKSENTASTAKANSQVTPAGHKSNNIQVQKFNNALVNLDDAQVELRQELTVITEKYNNAVIEKEKAIQNCKNLKKEIKAINKKMKNVDKSKKMINANLESNK